MPATHCKRVHGVWSVGRKPVCIHLVINRISAETYIYISRQDNVPGYVWRLLLSHLQTTPAVSVQGGQRWEDRSYNPLQEIFLQENSALDSLGICQVHFGRSGHHSDDHPVGLQTGRTASTTHSALCDVHPVVTVSFYELVILRLRTHFRGR
jgi:hypothetical protein